MQGCLWSLLAAGLLAQLFLGWPGLSDVSCDVISLKNPPPLLTASESLLVQLAMSSSSPSFPALSTCDILEADGVCQVCL